MINIKNRGISVIEILVVISIIGILSAVVISNLSSFHNQQVLKNTTEDLVSLLNEARNSTISSKNSTTYGVHLQTDRAILFTGATFVDDISNKQIDFDSTVLIPATGGINLSGGGSDIVFSRITGDTVNNGTIIIQQTNDSSKQKIININTLGVIGVN
jgi:prepilin-type N-terminal cleavage/methylation domain-containing protein